MTLLNVYSGRGFNNEGDKTMKKFMSRSAVCQVCGKTARRSALVSAEMVRGGVIELISRSHPDWSPQGYTCIDELNHFRAQYIESLLEIE